MQLVDLGLSHSRDVVNTLGVARRFFKRRLRERVLQLREFLHVFDFGECLGLLNAVGKRAFRRFQLQFEHALGTFKGDTGKTHSCFQIRFIQGHKLLRGLEHDESPIKRTLKSSVCYMDPGACHSLCCIAQLGLYGLGRPCQDFFIAMHHILPNRPKL